MALGAGGRHNRGLLLPYNPGRQLTGTVTGSESHVALHAFKAISLRLRRKMLLASGDHSDISGGR